MEKDDIGFALEIRAYSAVTCPSWEGSHAASAAVSDVTSGCVPFWYHTCLYTYL